MKNLYGYVIMLFRLYNAPATFQRLVNLMFADYIYKFVTIYKDNILEYSETY